MTPAAPIAPIAPISRAVLVQAAHWHVELCCGGADPQALAAWLAESGEHARAWDLLRQMDGQRSEERRVGKECPV